MAKKGKIIKRIYEKGREKTIFSSKKRSSAKRPIRAASSKDKSKFSVQEERPESKKPIAEQPARTGTKPQPAEIRQEKRPFTEHYELPSHYGTTQLTLIVKDPHWIYAYWEIAPHSIASLRNSLRAEEAEQAQVVLRMYDVTLKEFNGYNANSSFDIEVGSHATNWYVNLWQDCVSYIGDVGLRVPDGRFFTLARSNYVHTPRTNFSPRTEQMWMKVTDEKYTHPYVQYKEKNPHSKNEVTKKRLASAAGVAGKKRTIFLTEEDIRQYYGKLSPLLRDIISSRISKLHGKKVQGYPFVFEAETEEERQTILSMLPRDYVIKRMLLGSSQELVILGGGSENRVKGPGGASEFMHGRIKERQFFFELNAELIVYGRTEPNATVFLGNKKIPLRNDGTFSLRFALPDGKIPMEFTAISYDQKEKRKIRTDVERRTKHGD